MYIVKTSLNVKVLYHTIFVREFIHTNYSLFAMIFIKYYILNLQTDHNHCPPEITHSIECVFMKTVTKFINESFKCENTFAI